MAWSRWSAPPVMRRGFRDWGADIALNCSKIWIASSLECMSKMADNEVDKSKGFPLPSRPI